MTQKVLEKPKGFYECFDRKPGDNKTSTHYCPGCGHGILHKLIAEAIADLGVQERTIFISPVGCSVFGYYYFGCGNIQSAHGRAPAVATGTKRGRPNSIVISYQGDGDLGAIGGNEILQAANRGENITVFFINNAIYGMTGGQLAPTSLIGMKTMTTPRGRTVENEGYPLRVCELLSQLEAPVYIERTAMMDGKTIMKTRKAVQKALQCQIDGLGFSLVEVISPCPSGWKLDPVNCMKWIKDNMLPYFPLKVFKDETKTRQPKTAAPTSSFAPEQVREVLGITTAHAEETARIETPENYRNPRLKIAGFGGQGILLLGEILAEAGMEYGYNVSWLPSYGPEMRGGTANCHVMISERKIGAPVVLQSDVLIAMNKPSLYHFEPDVRPNGVIIYNTSLIDTPPTRKDVEVVGLPATEMADKLGNTRVANMVTAGAYVAYTRILPLEALLNVLPAAIKKTSLIPLNEQAIQEGAKFVQNLRKR
jgi:2-oxoisovalerate ferredoxin oxidoreductase beta subunit